MKTEVFSLTRFQAINKVLQSNASLFENKPQAAQMVDSFNQTVTGLRDIMVRRTVPAKSIVVQRKMARKELIAGFSRVLSMALAVAAGTGNQDLEITLREYKKRFRMVSVQQLILMIENLNELLGPLAEQAVNYGFEPQALEALLEGVAAYKAKADLVNDAFGSRSADRNRSSQLIKSGNQLLKVFFDQFVQFSADEHPAFAASYRRVRFSRRRRPSTRRLPENSDISGIVTHASTNEPIPGASVMLLQHNEIETTGKDGYFLFSDLQPGTYTLSCHAVGYLVPEPVTVTLNANDSLIHNFTLSPVPSGS
ncbi:MAG TPA: carboxypeptidase-like regulatory domain-containing protein [Bacteroidales bacterium]|nr:carboxypeptidase-like regulatory domain-containing protein [Bacteroidales bacterium]